MSDLEGVHVAVLGLGEAGIRYATGLADRGAAVSAYDPAFAGGLAGVRVESTSAAALEGADLALSMVGAQAADMVAETAFQTLDERTVFADMNTASPEQKLAMSRRAAARGIPFADVAIMAPVPRAGVETPLVVSGTGAQRLISVLAGLGIPIERVDGDAGAAAGLKLIRSVFMKGLAGLVFETLTAAERIGADEWIREQLASELGSNGRQLVDRLIEGTRLHASRREHEMHDVRSYLQSLDAPTWMTEGTLRWLHSLAE